MKLRSIFSSGHIMIIAMVLSIFAFQSCKDDDVIPTTATFSGIVTIENTELWETWADSGEVQLTFFPEFNLDPLAGWGEYPDNTFGPGSPAGVSAVGAPVNSQSPLVFEYVPGRSEYGYEFTLTNLSGPVTFSALAIGFSHDGISSANLKSATLGVHWGNENEVSHGIVIRPAIGADPIFDFPAPVSFTVSPGDEQIINFKADFAFVEDWY